jgi:hypothetical protein
MDDVDLPQLTWRDLKGVQAGASKQGPPSSPSKKLKLPERKTLLEAAQLVRPKPVDFQLPIPVYLLTGVPHVSPRREPRDTRVVDPVEIPSMRDNSAELQVKLEPFERSSTWVRSSEPPIDSLDARVLYEASEEDLAFLDQVNSERAAQGKVRNYLSLHHGCGINIYEP